MFSSEVPDYKDTDTREESNDVLVEYSLTSAVFSNEISMEEIELSAAQKEKFEHRENSK